NLSAIVDNLETLTTIVANTDGTFTFTDENGAPTIIDIANLETLTSVALNSDNTNLQFIDEDGTVNLIDLTPLVENLETLTTMVANPGSTFTYTDETGTATTIDIKNLETLTSILNNGDGTITYTDEVGANQTIDLVSNDANNDITVGADGGLYLNVASVTISETITNISDTGDGTITYVNEDGTTQKVNKSDIIDNLDGTYTFTNNDSSDVIINTNGVNISNVIAGNRIATVTDAAGTVTDIDETITTLTDNGDGTFTHTSENGTVTLFDAKRSTVVDNANGTYTITDEIGTPQVIDTRANSNPYTPTSGLISTNVQGAIDELALSIDQDLGNSNLTQTAAVDRTYDINGQNLGFTNGQVGIGIVAPTSTLHTAGSFATSITSIFADTSLNETHHTLIIGATLEIDLPAADSCVGRIYIIKNPASNPVSTPPTPDFSVTFAILDEYIDSFGNTKTTLDAGVTQLQSDGTDWQQINN
ncbi:hypothetical protein ABXZ36_15735, partial [Sediminicola arcticus]